MSDMTAKGKTRRGKRYKMNEIQVTGVLAERTNSRGQRMIKLRKAERKEFLHQRRIEKAVALFLDLEADHNWQEIADQVGISVMGLKDMTKTKEFMDVYSRNFVELGHDPRLRATQAAIADMLPSAVRELRELITGLSTPTVRLAAIKEVLRLNGLDKVQDKSSDRDELARFLKESGAQITINNQQNNILPQDFQQNIAAYTEGRFRDISSYEDEIKDRGKLLQDATASGSQDQED
jgi:hypothetical protein